MGIRMCPECGHEITDRGRFCLFCGCDLRKMPAKVIEKAPGQAADVTPVKASKFSWNVVLIMLIAVCCAFAAAAFFHNEGRSEDPALRYGMTFKQAAAEMERCGFVPDGVKSRKDGIVSRNYKENRIYGRKAWLVELRAMKEEGGRVTLTAYFQDSDNGYVKETSVLTGLKDYLTKKHGKPEARNAVYEYYYWELADGYIMLMDAGDTVMVGESHEKSGGVS